MKKRFTILMAAFTLLAFLAIPIGMKGQSTKTEGFESATTSTTYNSTATVNANQSDCGIGWSIYYGTVSTNGALVGSQSAQMRWYKSASSNYPYLQSTTAISNLTDVAFKAKVGNTAVKMDVSYSSDGTNWTALATAVTFSNTNATDFSYSVPTGGKYIKIGVSSSSTAPTANYYSLLVDNVVFTYSGNVNTYTVTYHANVTGVTDIEIEYSEGDNVTVAANTFSNPGHAFTGWNTEAEGNGTNYAPGDEIEDIDEDIELYAQWEESSTVTYTYNFAGANNFYTDAALTTHPSTGSGNNVGTIYYGDGSTFVASGTSRYFSSASSGYFLLGKTGAQISLPTFDGYKITQVIVHTSGSVSGNVKVSIVSGNNTASAAQQWAANSDFTYDIDADYQTSALSLNVTNNYNSQFTSIELVCEADVPSTDPHITASNVDITYDATSGSIAYTIENEPTPVGTLTANTNANWLTLGTVTSEAVPFTCTENDAVVSRTATVTLTYTYGNDAVTKDVTVTQAAAPMVYNTMQSIFDKATEVGNTATSVNIALQNWVVSGVSTNGKNVFVTDGTKGFVIFDSNGNMGFAVGNVLSGTVSCKVQLYHGFAEITELNSSTEGISIATGGTVTEANIAMAELAGVNTGALVSYDNLTCSVTTNGNNTFYNLSDGTTTIQVYNSLYAFDALTDGKTYNITGVYQQYNSTKEILPRSADDIEEVVSSVPTITVTPALVEVNYEEHDGTLGLTYENIEINDMNDFVVQYYNAEGQDIDGPEWIEVLVAEQDPTIGEGYVVSYFMNENEGEARSAYFKIYVDNVEAYSNLVTITQAQYVVDYATLPFEWDSFGETPTGITNNGVPTGNNNTYLKFDGTGDNIILKFNERPGTLTFNVKGNPGSDGWAGTFDVQTSVDGVNYTTLATYEELSTTDYQEESFANLDEEVRYIKWVYTEKVSGNVAVNYILLTAYAEPVPAITVSETTITAPADGAQGTLNVTYTEIESYDMYWCESDGTTETDQPNWIEFDFDTDGNIIYNVYENEGEARTAYFKVYGLDSEEEDIYSELVTVNQAAYVAPVGGQFALFGGNLVEGDYIIYYDGKAMNNVVSSGRLQYAEIEPEDNVITTDNAAIVWHIAPNDEGYWTIYSADANAYAASTGVKNKAQMLEDGTDDMAMWTVTEISGTYEFVNKANSAGDVNANLRNNGTYGFACYATSTGGALSLYKHTETTGTYTMGIDGYGTNPGGYYLIASPVLAVTPTVDNGFLSEVPEEYDLYYFDQAENNVEWRNYKAHHFNIASGKGYLYASKEGTTLSFSGAPYSGDGTITLTKTEGVNLPGWNLVGNPYSDPAVIDREDFYVIQDTDEGSIFIQSSGEIEPMQGIFVIAEQDGETLTFETNTPPETGEKIVMTVRNNRSNIIDRALVRFGEGRQLPKFMFNPNNTKLYINQNGEEFAVVRSNNEGEMPVNFKAATNGTYTFSINADNVEMEYLHLLDNLTGTDVDLLATPNYTFEANTIDNANRFKLVYATTTNVNENNGEPFAFFNGNEWIISNEGKATLQVVDMTGRIISTSTINGNASTKVNAATGVYMLRLTNGNDVKTQRVIVK